MKNRKLSRGKRGRLVRLDAYLVAGMGIAGFAASAEASIVVIDVTLSGLDGPNASLLRQPQSYYRFTWWPVQGQGSGPALEVYYDYNGNTGLGGAFGLQIAAASSNASPTRFASQAAIGSSATFHDNDAYTVFQTSSGVSPDFGAGSYVGFRFTTDSGANWNYGWMEVTWTGSTDTFQIYAAAYESTANTSIAAGATTSGGGAVPEPTSGAMVALLLGGTALNQWRKNRRESSEENGELAS